MASSAHPTAGGSTTGDHSGPAWSRVPAHPELGRHVPLNPCEHLGSEREHRGLVAGTTSFAVTPAEGETHDQARARLLARIRAALGLPPEGAGPSLETSPIRR